MHADAPDIHIGNEIHRRLLESGMPFKEFASRLCCERNSLYYLFRQKSIDIERLIKISQILNFDFVSMYTQSAPEANTPIIGVVVLEQNDVGKFQQAYPNAHTFTLKNLSKKPTE